jgi:putative ABC transport system substrate-binding protein
MRRRDFIGGLGGVGAWSIGARAQPSAIPVIGYLNAGSPEGFANLVTAFRRGLSEAGYVEGRNVAIEFRWAQNQLDRVPELAADLVRRRVAVIVAVGEPFVAHAAKAATAMVPIVFATGADPVAYGLVASLNRPGGNVTGYTGLVQELIAKKLGLLHAAIPAVKRVGALANPSGPTNESMVADLRAAAAVLGLQMEVIPAITSREIDTAFASLAEKQVGALLVFADALFISRRVQLVILSAKYGVPAIFPVREAVEIGGLMSYGPNFSDVNRQVGIYAGRILKGEKPADLPVMRATKLEFVLNAQTATTLDIDLPLSVLPLADEVVQ